VIKNVVLLKILPPKSLRKDLKKMYQQKPDTKKISNFLIWMLMILAGKNGSINPKNHN